MATIIRWCMMAISDELQVRTRWVEPKQPTYVHVTEKQKAVARKRRLVEERQEFAEVQKQLQEIWE